MPLKKSTKIPRRSNACYGWKPDLPDHRDLLYSAPIVALQKLPAKVDLSNGCPPVYDQGQLGSCTANAISAALQFDQKKQKLKSVMPSRLFIYYNERDIEGTVNQDSGAMIRDGIRSVNKLGSCPEKMWPYDPGPYPPNPKVTPSNAQPDERLSGFGLSVRFRLHGISELRK